MKTALSPGPVTSALAGTKPGGFTMVGVVGSGAMGRGIAEACLRAGMKVILHDSSPDALSAARLHIEGSFQRSLGNNRIGQREATDGLARLYVTEELSEFSDCDLAIEAVPEILAIKTEVLGRLADYTAAGAIIASNTSSIPITKLANAVSDPSLFLGLHFFNPVPRMRLVEVIPTVLTDPQTTSIVESFVQDQLDKTALTVPDRPGFAVNALLIPYLLSAARMLDAGYASPESIDQGMKLGCGHSIGPLELSDFVGLDVVCHVADSIHAETGDPACIVPNNLRRLVDAGYLGRKTGRGFYHH